MLHQLTNRNGSIAEEWLTSEQLWKKDESRSEEVVYCEVDGSMILTREDKWKEVKLGRVFRSGSILPEATDRQWIKESEYIAHLGNHEEFEEKMSVLLDRYEKKDESLVFVTDGAKWIDQWIKACYPTATTILDYYHAAEHIGEFANKFFDEDKKSKKWTKRMNTKLINQGGNYVIKRIQSLSNTDEEKEEVKQDLLTYLKNNAHRMNYPKYKKVGLLIGSGAIEAAHRTVIQKRLKLSGQRWSKPGAQNVLNLRTLHMSGHWSHFQRYLGAAA